MKRVVCALCALALLVSACGKQPAESGSHESDPVGNTAPSETETGLPPESAPEEPAGIEPYSHVAVIGVDGAGAFFQKADTPNLDRILANGARTYRALSSNPTISAQCWGSMLTGVTPEYHRLNNTLIAERPYPADSQFPTVFRIIREAMPDAKLGAFATWNPINVGIVDDGLGIHKETASGDGELCGKIREYVEKEAKFKLVDMEQDDELELTDDEKIDLVAARVLKKYRKAFEELAK